MPLILGANSVSGFSIKNSLRFNSGSSDYLNRTLGSGNRRTYTFSCWYKKTKNAVWNAIYDSHSSTTYQSLSFNDSDKLQWYNSISAYQLTTTQVFRDVSAWYHILSVVDTTQATASDRVKIYINGTQVSAFDTASYPTQNYDTYFNNSQPLYLGAYNGNADFINGYISEIYMIDGQALTPSSFGETDTLSGIWIPKAYTGTYGTNGFYLKFADSSSLGTDSSGNGNNFTVNNLTSVDQSTDTPTNNFATMNPLTSYGTVTLAEGNLQVNVPNNTANSTSTFMVSSGKWYWEVKPTVGTLAMVGIRPEGMNYNQNSLFNLTGDYQGYYYYGDSGNIRPANTAYGNTFGVGDIIGVALDLDNNKLYFSKNGTFQNSGVPTSGATGTGAVSIATSGLTWGFSFTSGGNSDTIQCNFGNPPYSANSYTDGAGYGNFSYSVPSGFYSLCTRNLAQFG